MNSIDFSRSRAILVGTAHYTHGLKRMDAARNSLETMRGLLTGPLCGWPPECVKVFEDKTTRDGLNQEIAKLIHESTDVLLFYYVGHGQLLDGEHLGMALVDTHAEPEMRHSTSLRLDDLRTELKYRCSARVKLIILDCCFSGIATRNIQGPGLADQVRMATKVEGAYTLTASRASQKAVHQEGPVGLTYFTKIFAEVVRDGIPGAGVQLTLKDIHKEVAARFLRLDLPDGLLRPEPSVLAVDTAEELAFARNIRAPQQETPPNSPPETEPPPSQPPPSPPPPSGRPFTISWTGREPLSSYTTAARSWAEELRAYVSAVALTVALLSVAILAIPLALGEVHGGLLRWFEISAATGPFALFYLWACDALWTRRYLHPTPPWSLHVGPQGIVTTSAVGERQYRWDQVEKIAVKPIAEYGESTGFNGLHIRLPSGEKHPSKERPAGWPRYTPGPQTSLSGMVPICVLGPMTNRQLAEFNESLDRYGPPQTTPLATQALRAAAARLEPSARRWLTKLSHHFADNGSTVDDDHGR